MIRFGIVGTNWITDELIRSASNLADFQLSAVYSRTEEKGKEFAEKHGVDIVFTSIEEMAKSEVVDAVYIASPNSLHAEQAIIFMENGKHVLCEKPIASNPAELARMLEAAKKNNVLLMEALKTTLLPNFISIQENIHKIGKVRRYFASFCKYSSRYDAYREGTVLNTFNPKFSNGSLMDLGIYCLYPLVVLFGEPKNIIANAVMLDSGVDGGGSLILQYDDFEAVLMHSKIIDSHLHSEIQGEEGSIIIDEISTPEQVEIRYRNGEIEKISEPSKFPSMFYEVEEFIGLIKSETYESQVNSHKNSMIAARILAEARKQIGLVYPADLSK
ncbi:Gfo/Idh/MocA family protein [Lederbergia citrea]|uniref:Gfo/Idh/MocA family oxidoreductase n=1 Tax=Lederbergia citrea TaxID=2833581 RepID=A0A942Z4E4_9BACI|nr:Gfo/Idh/MocA family oxidoreductase [Lederbergia citrea]MBS4179334.1 Gfo/Idh/MocA family oxidoreductase [Lederbergia citrea]MBS4206003.1 Gfo/Idh/MocA family oxidoreductase [Lederbergia citrea]MBS4224548.1 Gfo/Idh/MocA family oxidoreductase [Lederbergia citrea]